MLESPGVDAATPKAGDPWGSVRGRGLRAWLADHRAVSSESVAFVSSRLGTGIVVWVLIGIALALPAGLYLLQVNLAAMLDGWQGRPGLSVYFRAGADLASAEHLQRELAGAPGVLTVTLTTPEEALDAFQRMAGLADALAGLERNPLPASLRVVVNDTTATDVLDALAERIRGAPGVDEVSIEHAWLQRLRALTDLVRRLGAVLGVLFGVAAVLVASTSVRLAIESRLDELKVMKLVGATEAYIRRPFLYLGLVYGLGGAIVAAMVISTLLLILEPPLAQLFGSYGEVPAIVGFTPSFFAQLLGIGAVLGVGGALLAARQRLSDLEVL
jgi:cell division transport system permease protein